MKKSTNSELIFTTSEDDKICIIDDCMVIKYGSKRNTLITSWYNGGYNENIKTVFNHSISDKEYLKIKDNNYETYLKNIAYKLNIYPKYTTGVMTSASMDNISISTKKYKDIEVTSIVTAGTKHTGIQAGDPASFYEHDNKFTMKPGTINTFILINSYLNENSLLIASITATEAKTVALRQSKVPSKYSSNLASGTGTDSICIMSNMESSNKLDNAGKHSKLGELIGKSVIEATINALKLENKFDSDYQCSVLSRLERYNIDFYDFYSWIEDSLNIAEFGVLLYPFIDDEYNVGWISSILNIYDEIQVGLISKDIGEILILDLIKMNTKFKDYNLSSKLNILDYLVYSIVYKITKNKNIKLNKKEKIEFHLED